ncbi:MAG: fibronectin-binding protein [Leptospiraceae bacterium]|nr:fibronectin-binding protein [Leptospiraceae bacterium]MCB1302948.1 fibronectin-binding protein [Leptospiraceae bacterium]
MRIQRTAMALVLALSFMGAGLHCSQDKGQGVSGEYQVQGSNPDGSPYRGTVQITRDGDAYKFEWNIAGQQYSGVGVREGDTLTVDWGQQDPVVYQVQDDGNRLVGSWAAGQANEELNR